MYLENVENYVKSGKIPDEKHYKDLIIGVGIFTAFLGLLPDRAYRGSGSVFAIIMCFTFIACLAIVLWGIHDGLTRKMSLWLDIVVHGGWAIEMSLVVLVWLTIWHGFKPLFLTIYLPMILLPLIFCISTYIKLKRNTAFPIVGEAKIISTKTSVIIGIVTVCLTRVFTRLVLKDIDQNTAQNVAIFCLTVPSWVISLEFSTFQKLYFSYKYDID